VGPGRAEKEEIRRRDGVLKDVILVLNSVHNSSGHAEERCSMRRLYSCGF
jgi:hypothetical protein